MSKNRRADPGAQCDKNRRETRREERKARDCDVRAQREATHHIKDISVYAGKL